MLPREIDLSVALDYLELNKSGLEKDGIFDSCLNRILNEIKKNGKLKTIDIVNYKKILDFLNK